MQASYFKGHRRHINEVCTGYRCIIKCYGPAGMYDQSNLM